MTAIEQLQQEAETLGKKIWNRAKPTQLGSRIFTDKQFSNLSRANRDLVKSGWISWAYCNFGIDQLSNECGFRQIVRKGT